MVYAFDEITLFNAGDKFFKGVVAAFDIGICHSYDRLELAIHCASVARKFFVKRGGSRCGMKSSRKDTVFNEISLFTFCAFVVVRDISASEIRAAVDNRQQIGANFFAEFPFFCHGFVAKHEVGFRFMAEGFMCENACRKGR